MILITSRGSGIFMIQLDLFSDIGIKINSESFKKNPTSQQMKSDWNLFLFQICGENLAQFKPPVTLQATPVYKHAFLRSANKVGLFALKCVVNRAGNKVPSFYTGLSQHTSISALPKEGA